MPVMHDADIQHGVGRAATLVAATTTAAGAVDTTSAVYIPGAPFTAAAFDLNVTAAATEVGDTFDVYVHTSLDGGTTWINIVHFTQVLGNGGAKHETMVINPRGNVGTAPINTAANAASAGVRHILGSRFKVQYVQVDANSNAAFAFSVNATFL